MVNIASIIILKIFLYSYLARNWAPRVSTI